ncbi:hypothetical protein CYPRO_1895 [Cyclonatronum proteinivorum]|uniref:histidine kinase n=1 Tax=Cyclonatronum proteinivorum TaxID=1457365 RepID=A0A345UKZ3_9BACT|nr:ATP-binding protein [Cyclonatronum proteinivorum]AXJ01145.1 hypothetical protein CYPRO_1895 [Cyclonatronum proteinivorum]
MNYFVDQTFADGYVLLAEDSMVQAKKLKRFFDTRNIKAVVCKNGQDALEQAKKEKPELIISDVMMPVMDGYEFCSKVKSEPSITDVPFILLTSLGDPMDIIRGLQAGADNFITKPYEESYLMSRISYLIANRHVRRMGSGDMSIEIVFQNQKFEINSDKKQILDLLLSVYEAAISRNEELINTQRRLEKLNEDLKEANQELEAFTRTVSHDLRSPLSGIIGLVELLMEDFATSLDKEAFPFLEAILHSSQNMQQLINDLLSFSRSGSLEISPHEIDLTEMVKNIVADLTNLTYRHDCEITIDEGMKINADPKLFRVLMNNLIENSLKYSQNKENPHIHIGHEESDGQTVFFVKDNGTGFDMDKADNLFRPFIRLHDQTQYDGTGVGLSTVKRIVDRHGGQIWFDSKPGQGTTFYFSI